MIEFKIPSIELSMLKAIISEIGILTVKILKKNIKLILILTIFCTVLVLGSSLVLGKQNVFKSTYSFNTNLLIIPKSNSELPSSSITQLEKWVSLYGDYIDSNKTVIVQSALTTLNLEQRSDIDIKVNVERNIIRIKLNTFKKPIGVTLLNEVINMIDKRLSTYLPIDLILQKTDVIYLSFDAPLIVYVPILIFLCVLAIFVTIEGLFDKTIKSSSHAANVLPYPILGSVSNHPIKRKGIFHRQKQTVQRPIASIIKKYYITDQISTICTLMLKTNSPDKTIKSIMVTSSIPGEGKSSIISNIAVILANIGLRVVLIDMDIRRPKINKIFNLPNEIGISNHLMQLVDLTEIIQITNVQDNLSIITSGPEHLDPYSLVNSVNVKNMFNQLKEQFDIILIDSPPVQLVAEALVISPLVDGCIVVVGALEVHKDIILNTCERLKIAGANIIGTVINKVNEYDYETSKKINNIYYYSDRSYTVDGNI